MTNVRRFRVDDDVEWTVFEVIPTQSLPLSGALSDGWLCFERGDEVRRLTPIPPKWETASASALAAMLAQAKAVRNTPP
jgi:hypothetical protein